MNSVPTSPKASRPWPYPSVLRTGSIRAFAAATSLLGALALSGCAVPGEAHAQGVAVPLRPAQAAAAANPWPSPFGIGASHVNSRSATDFARWIPYMVRIGINNQRNLNVAWHEIEPVRGTFLFQSMDQQAAYLKSQGVSFGAMLWGNPGWNTLDKPGGLPVLESQGWARYVTAVATRLKGKSYAFEIWNEPPNGIRPDQTAADYAQLVVAAYRAIKAVDPAIKVGLAAKSTHIHFLELAIEQGARDHFDYITLHPYESLNTVLQAPIGERAFAAIAPSVRRMLARANPAKKDVPLVFTELGVDVGRGARVQSTGLIKAYTLGIAQGVTNIQWFEGRDGDSGPLGLIAANGAPREAYQAMASMIRYLGHKPSFVGRVPLTTGSQGYVFNGAAGPVMVAWAKPGEAPSTVLGQDRLTVIDPFTGAAAARTGLMLASAPALVTGLPKRVLDTAATHPAGRLFADEDFTAAQEVSISFVNGVPVSRGLYTLATADVLSAVKNYGGGARSGDLPGGTVFAVDPSFIVDRSTPIEIEITVKRSAANANAGFNLRYESLTRDGFRQFPNWYTVPDNKTWHSAKYRLNDAGFVGQWGYHFALLSDCPGCGDYVMQKVTVRKLPSAPTR